MPGSLFENSAGRSKKNNPARWVGHVCFLFSGEHPKRKIDILFARSLYRKYWCRRLRGWGSMMVWHVHFDFTHRTTRYPLANTLAIRRLPGCVQVTAFARSMANLCKRWRIVSQSLSTAWRLLGSKSSGICQNPSREANYVLCCDSVYWLTGLRGDVEIKTAGTGDRRQSHRSTVRNGFVMFCSQGGKWTWKHDIPQKNSWFCVGSI